MKYTLQPEGDLFRIISEATGEVGGLVSGPDNLSQEGDCWIGYDASVLQNARVTHDARILGCAMICGSARISAAAMISGNARVYGNAMVDDNAWVLDDAKVYGNADVRGSARLQNDVEVFDNAKIWMEAKICMRARVCGSATVTGSAIVTDLAEVYGYALVSTNTIIKGNARVHGSAWIYDSAVIYGSAEILGHAKVYETAQVFGETKICDYAKISGNAKVYGSSVICDEVEVFGNAEVYGYSTICGDRWIYDNRHFCNGVEVETFEAGEAEPVARRPRVAMPPRHPSSEDQPRVAPIEDNSLLEEHIASRLGTDNWDQNSLWVWPEGRARMVSFEFEVSNHKLSEKQKELFKKLDIVGKGDGSLSGKNPREFVFGPRSVEHLKEDLALFIKIAGAEVNDSCGAHVHVDARDFSHLDEFLRLFRFWKRIKSLIMESFPASRTNNYFCKVENEAEPFVLRSTTMEQFKSGVYEAPRYRALNMHSYFKRQSVEFRILEGTVDVDSIVAWATFCRDLVSSAKMGVRSYNSLTTREFVKKIAGSEVWGWFEKRRYLFCDKVIAPTINNQQYLVASQEILHEINNVLRPIGSNEQYDDDMAIPFDSEDLCEEICRREAANFDSSNDW